MAVQIRERLCASLQKCSNRSHWKALSFAITHYGNALHFSVQATVSPLLKSEKEQTPPAISPSIQEQQEEEKVKQLKTTSGNRYSEDIEQDKLLKQTSLLKTKKKLSDWSIQTSAPEAVAPTTQKPEKQWPVKSKKSDQIQRETPNATKEQQKGKRDAATQIDLDVDQKLSDSTTVLFGPYPLVKDGTQSVKCVQVGDGNIQQLK